MGGESPGAELPCIIHLLITHFLYSHTISLVRQQQLHRSAPESQPPSAQQKNKQQHHKNGKQHHHHAKSSPTPSADPEWLGVRWLTVQGMWGIPLATQEKCLDLLRHLHSGHSCTRREWVRLIGILNFVSQILTHTRHLLQPLLRPQLLGSHSNRDHHELFPRPSRTPFSRG